MLDINMEIKKGILFVKLKGSLNEEETLNLEKELISLIKNNGIKYVLLNINEVTDINKNKLKIVFKTYLTIIKNNGKLFLCENNSSFDYDKDIFDNLYQINEDEEAFNIINI